VSDAVRVMDALTACAPRALDNTRVSAVSRNDGDLIYRGFAGTALLDVLTAAFVHPFHLRDVPVCHRVRRLKLLVRRRRCLFSRLCQ
jgi:hypothetical protein